MYIFARTYTLYICMFVWMYVYMCVYMCICVYVCMYTCIMYVCVCMRVCIYVYMLYLSTKVVIYHVCKLSGFQGKMEDSLFLWDSLLWLIWEVQS
jgi:nuclear pore complex protein Nup62